jgi:hypothetical protein
MVPTVAFPPEKSFTLHVTLSDAPLVPVTVAVKTCAAPVGTLGDGGTTVTTMFGGGGGEVDVVDPAQADSNSAQMQTIARQKAGTYSDIARSAKIRAALA